MVDTETIIFIVGAAACIVVAVAFLMRMVREKTRLVERYTYLKTAMRKHDEMERLIREKREAYIREQRRLAGMNDAADQDAAEPPVARVAQPAESAEPAEIR